MSLPNIPDITPDITIDINAVINLILASIGLEEIGISHILNAEGEKIQAALGTLTPGVPPLATNLNQLLLIDESVSNTLRSLIKKEMLLEFKLEDTIDLLNQQTPPQP